MNEPRSDLSRNTLGVLFIGGLIFASFWIMRPFLAPLIWAQLALTNNTSFRVLLSNPTGGAVLGTTFATVTIQNAPEAGTFHRLDAAV